MHRRVLGRLASVSFDCLFCFSGLSSNYQTIESRSIQPTNFLCIISWRRLWERLILCFAVSSSPKKGYMVWTRLRATSSRHQESRDASSNPHYDRQSAPITQPPSIQHVQSMAATMAKLTHQNQELTMEISLRGQRHERYAEGQAQSQEDKGRNTKLESQSRGIAS